jgi:hypothetical protein
MVEKAHGEHDAAKRKKLVGKIDVRAEAILQAWMKS